MVNVVCVHRYLSTSITQIYYNKNKFWKISVCDWGGGGGGCETKILRLRATASHRPQNKDKAGGNRSRKKIIPKEN